MLGVCFVLVEELWVFVSPAIQTSVLRTLMVSDDQSSLQISRHCTRRSRSRCSTRAIAFFPASTTRCTLRVSFCFVPSVSRLHRRTYDVNFPCFAYTVLKTLEDIGVDLILGERLDIESTKAENIKFNARGQRVVRTLSGREVAADLMVGPRPICWHLMLKRQF